MKIFANFAVLASTAFAAEYLSVKEPVDGSYLVVFNQDSSLEAVNKHMDLVRAKNMTVKFEYNINEEFRGYNTVGHTDKSAIDFILNHEDVNFVEEDGVVRTLQQPLCTGPTQNVASGLWGLARTSSIAPPTDGYTSYTYTNTGNNVDVYVIDTGIRTTHNDFGGRAFESFDATNEGDGDENGHGTHCASTVGGTTYGVAKNANLYAVKVLGRTGSGSTAGVIAGVDHVASRVGSSKKVGSMSLGGGLSQASNNAVDAASRAGVSMVVASGNSNANACNFSPASAPLAITVNSIERGDARSSFSNFGTCSDIFAPGSSVLGAWVNSDSSTNTISGTSMACPHVAGQVAKLFEATPSLTPAMVKTAILAAAADGYVISPGAGSPNKILSGC